MRDVELDRFLSLLLPLRTLACSVRLVGCGNSHSFILLVLLSLCPIMIVALFAAHLRELGGLCAAYVSPAIDIDAMYLCTPYRDVIILDSHI